jgi:hypothetical protein
MDKRYIDDWKLIYVHNRIKKIMTYFNIKKRYEEIISQLPKTIEEIEQLGGPDKTIQLFIEHVGIAIPHEYIRNLHTIKV